MPIRFLVALGAQKRVSNQHKEMSGSLVKQLTNVQNFYAAQIVPTLKATIDAQAAYIADLLRQASGKNKGGGMNSGTEKLTKLHLQAFGLSDYTVKQLLKGLDTVSINGGLKEYSASDIKASVEKRLANPKIKAENQAKLQRLLTWLNGESNVIPVDFFKGLPHEQKIAVLRDRIQELETQEQSLTEETQRLLTQARRMLATK